MNQAQHTLSRSERGKGMDFTFSKEEEEFRKEVRQWLKKEIPPRWHEISPGLWEENDEIWAIARQFDRRLAGKGWYAPSYPREYGGIEATMAQQLILGEEKSLLQAPSRFSQAVGVEFVGPTILQYGNEEQKRKYVRGIGTAELIFCLGYSEPQAGSDLGGLQTRAIEENECFVVNGQKTFTTFAHLADYCWLAARTDPEAPRHNGISMFVVDMKTPGITVRPLINIADSHSFNEVFFDDVRLPKDALVGEKNRGWYYLTTALNYERGGIIRLPATLTALLDELVRYVKETPGAGGVLADDEHVQQRLAELATEIEICRLLSYRVADLVNRGVVPTYENSEAFLFGNELLRRFAKTAGEILGPYGQLGKNCKRAPMRGVIQGLYLDTVGNGFGGGSSEIQRNIIALLGLGLPRG